jgi:transposase
MDLRQRVIAACEAGGRTRREIARQFQVSEATLYDWLQRQRAQGSPAPKPHMGGRTSALDKTVLRALVEEANDATLAEYAERLKAQTGRRYSASMISRVLKELKLSRKGRRYVPASISSPRSPLSA